MKYVQSFYLLVERARLFQQSSLPGMASSNEAKKRDNFRVQDEIG